METSQTASLLKIPKAGIKLLYRQVADILQNPLVTISNLTKKHGGIVQVRILHKKFIVVEDPDYFKYILQEQYKNFSKYDLSGLLTKFLGDGLITSNGQVWLQQRRIIQPAFHKQQLENFVVIIHNELDKLIGRLKKENTGKPIDISKQFMDLTFGIITRILFGETADTEIKEISRIMNDLAIQAEKQITQYIKLPLGIPSPANIRFKKVRRKFDTLLYTIIYNRKKQIDGGTVMPQDILQMLLTSSCEKSQTAMPVKQIRDELTTLFMAGYETTSQTLGWLFYEVARNPAISALIRAEIKTTIPGQKATFQKLNSLTYITNVIKETMRFYPSVWLMVRKNLSNDVLGPYFLPRRSIILLSIYGMHHNETYWKNPEEFVPDRFNTASMKEQHPYTFLPFGNGPRLCIGQPFAMMMMQIVVSRLISSFDWKPAGDMEVKMEPHITLRPKPAIYMQLTAIPEL